MMSGYSGTFVMDGLYIIIMYSRYEYIIVHRLITIETNDYSEIYSKIQVTSIFWVNNSVNNIYKFRWASFKLYKDGRVSLTLIRMTKDEKGLAFFKGLLL